MDDDASGKAEGAQSIRRAVAILSVLAAGQEAGVRLTDVTERTGLDTLCVARRLGVFPIQVLMVDVGQRRPLGMSSAGLAMLARLQEVECEEILTQNEVRLRRLGLSLPRVRELVATTQRRGHVIREHGLIPGTKVVSVALEAPGGKSLAAFTAAGIDRRMSQQHTAEIAARLKESVARIETMLPR
ncbi:IclR family transcriptional regulator [Acidocella facilis]|uniref:IclR family transcriptional regulator C-terminal domain-containing protein n=1 Tax=Acidocella facilis TaxID=525 RepID=UPI001F24BCA7|nr:IclR family transcriptional regulator C-terminal domain-containing protein [Acidocella facilis]